MSSPPPTYVSLKGGRRAHTASYVEMRGGKLVIGLHDMSPETESALGRECIWEVIVDEAAKDRLLVLLVAAHFVDYDEAAAWLAAQAIPYNTRFDPDA